MVIVRGVPGVIHFPPIFACILNCQTLPATGLDPMLLELNLKELASDDRLTVFIGAHRLHPPTAISSRKIPVGKVGAASCVYIDPPVL